MLNYIIIIISIVLSPILWIILYPLIICIKYKIKYGQKVAILYYPLAGLFKLRNDGVKYHKDVIYFKRQIAYQQPNVEVIITNVLGKPYILFIKLQQVKSLLYNHDNYKKRTDEIFRDIIASQGMVYAQDQEWKQQRKQLSDFFTYEQLQTKIPIIKQIVNEIMSNINENNHIIEECAKITSKIMQICFFNQFDNDLVNNKLISQEFQELSNQFIFITYGSIIHQLRSFFGIKSNSTMKKWLMTQQENQFLIRVQGVREYINNLINKHKSDNQNDIMSLMLQNGLNNQIREQIIHQYITFIFAGTDTTSHLAGMSLYALGLYPDIQEQIRNEIKSINFDQIDYKIIKSLQKLNNFINECLRIYTPSDGIIPRIAIKGHYINQYQIKKGWYVDAGLQPLMTHPEYFYNNLQFDIERWQNNQIHEAFIPFSFGPRNCIGQNLAQIEVKIIIFYILKNYKILLNQETELIMQQGFLYTPQDDRLIKLQKI